jgi:flagellar FliL protein
MSAAAAAPTVDADVVAPAKKGKKKLIIIAAVALLVVLALGGGAVFFMKKKAHDAQATEEGAPAAEHAAVKRDSKHAPTFLPLDPFVVNLADKDADRYAQIGITLEVEDAKFADDLKTYMPAIRDGILMILAHKTSRELLERSGKQQLAAQIQREAAVTMGLDVEEPDAEAAGLSAEAAGAKGKAADAEDPAKPKAKAAAKPPAAKANAERNPVRHVLFSNFIIQ